MTDRLERLMPKAAKAAFLADTFSNTTMRILIGLLVQNPGTATLVPPLENLDENQLPLDSLQRTESNTCLSRPGLTT